MPQTFAVAVKALIQTPEGKFLILFKSDTEDVNPHDFDVPGGRVQRGEKLEDAITREIKEETNLNVSIEKVSRARGFTQKEMHLVGITYLVHCEETNDIVLSGEHTDFSRKTKEEILAGDFPNRLKEEIMTVSLEK
jgi:8-oxo-dGTP diphosphatase